MRWAVGLAFLLGVSFPVAAQTTAARAPLSPVDIFREAHSRTQSVTPALNRGYLLGTLLEKSWGLPIDEQGQWAEEAFRVSQEMPVGSKRAFVQQMAISATSRRDPDGALAMLTRMDPLPPDAMTHFNIGQGLAVAGVFSAVLAKHGPSAAASLKDALNGIAAKGLYPYLALEALTSSATSDEVGNLFRQGVQAYTRSKPGVTNEFEFVNFLKRIAPRVPAPVSAAAAPAIAARMQRFASSDAKCDSTLRLYTDKGMIVLDCGERIIYEALPVLQKMNGEVAGRLRASPKFQQLDGATVKSRMPMANPLQPSDKAAESQAEFDIGMMTSDIAKENPERAAQLASGMADEARRLNMNVQIAGEMAAKEPEKARAMLLQALNDVAKMDDIRFKAVVISNIATAEARLRDLPSSELAIKSVFPLAQEFGKRIREHATPEQRILYASNGYGAWIVTRLGASVTPQLTLGLIPTIEDDECEAYLLMAFAEALMRPMPLN